MIFENLRGLKPFMQLIGRDKGHVSKNRLILKVVPYKIEYLEFGLMQRGYAGMQLWRATE